MVLDKELYLEAQKEYRRWNKAKALARAEEEGRLSPAEAWERYKALADFAYNRCPPPSERQRHDKIKALNRYYARMRKIETRRRLRGETT